MWLVLDIGNSTTKGGLFEEGELSDTFQFDLNLKDHPATWEEALKAHLQDRRVTRVGLASVVPPITALLAPLLQQLIGVPAEVIHHAMRMPFTMAYQTPHTLGLDRIAAAAAAWTRYGLSATGTPRPVIALDAGTAVTCEVLNSQGVFLGGTIGAAPGILRDALSQGTAQLPPVPLNLPPSPIGRSTQEALQAGILYAFLDGVAGILARITETLGEKPFVVATGGWHAFLQQHLDTIDAGDPHLVLHGVRVLLAMNEA